MIIKDLLPSQLPAQPMANGRSSSGINFQEILDKQTRSLAESLAPAEILAPVATASASPAPRIEGLAITEDLLAHLDGFGAALGNMAAKADELEPFVAALEEETAALVAVKGALPENDPLTALLDRVAAAAYVEAAKYRRGDYSA